MQVLVCIQPPADLLPGGDKLQTERHVSFHNTWELALDHVRGFARGDDPGQVTMLTVDALEPGDVKP